MYAPESAFFIGLLSAEQSDEVIAFEPNHEVKSEEDASLVEFHQRIGSSQPFASVRISQRVGGRVTNLTAVAGSNKDYFSVSVGRRSNVYLNGISCVTLDLSNSGSVTIEDCEIYEISITQTIAQGLTIKNSKVGRLVIESDRPFEDCEISNTHICELRLPSSFSCRDLVFKSVTFSTVAKPGHLKDENGRVFVTQRDAPVPDRASFAFLGDWATGAGNPSVAHIARGHDLAIERDNANGLERLILEVWRAASYFGLKPTWPLMWILFFYSIFTVLLFAFGSELGADVSSYVGWRAALLESDDTNWRLYRAAVGAAEGVVSPLSTFNIRRLVVPVDGWLATTQIAYNYACLVMLLLFGFSIRRRFRVS